MKRLLGLSAVLLVCVAVNSARAGLITVTNTTTNTTIFSDDGFEDDTVGTNPNAPTIGSWVKPSQTTVGAQVINAASPGPFDGLNYLKMNRATGANSNTAQEDATFSTA